MIKVYLILSCLVSSFRYFGCCADDSEKKKFKELVYECFGIKKSDIIDVFKGTSDTAFKTYIENEASDEVLNCKYWIKHKIVCYDLVCFIRCDIKPDYNKVRLISSSSEKEKDLHRGFLVYRNGEESYYELKKFDNFRKDGDS